MEQRVEQLEDGLKKLEANLGKLDQKVDQQKRDLEAKLDREIADLQAGVQRVGKHLEEGMIADSAFEVAGIVYVCIGLVTAHLSEEIARLLSWFGAT